MQNCKGQRPNHGRVLRRARNAVKRYAGRTEPKLVRRYERAYAFLLAEKLSK